MRNRERFSDSANDLRKSTRGVAITHSPVAVMEGLHHLRHVITSTVIRSDLLLRYVDDIANRPAHRLPKVGDEVYTYTYCPLPPPGSSGRKSSTNCSSLVVFCPVTIQLLIDVAYLLPQIDGRF
jgi:hypothetical protein